MRALTMDEVKFVSGGFGDDDDCYVPSWMTQGEMALSGKGGNAKLYACITIIGPSGAGVHACADSKGNVNVGGSIGSPGASGNAGVSNNATAIITGASATVGVGVVSVSAAPGAVGVGVNVGTSGGSVSVSPSSPVGSSAPKK
jgi:hypothetical protein